MLLKKLIYKTSNFLAVHHKIDIIAAILLENYTMQKPSLWAMSPEQINDYIKSNALSAFRANQLIDWIFSKRASSLDEMSNIPAQLKQKLLCDFDCNLFPIKSTLHSEDESTKLLLETNKNQLIETVILRYSNRTSLCVSSQVGCRLACSFCQTGKLGFFRHLATKEIMAQFVLANKILKSEGRKVTHVVFMGMGEPLDNFDNVLKALCLLTANNAYNLSHRKVTISTSGLAHRIPELAQKTNAALAISLHACRDSLRSELMPINKRYPLAVLKEALLSYQKITKQKITFEYILIKDKNCSQIEAKELVRFVEGLKCKINLIPFNSHPGIIYERPEQEIIEKFQAYLNQKGLVATVRYSKGLDVSAACGQLAAKQLGQIKCLPQRKNVCST